MSRLFISHSTWNNDKAQEVVDWLANNGWKDIFVDFDPERGIAAGQRFKEALQKAAYRCEVVLALVSKEWLKSNWCKSEVEAARLMGKKVIVALVGIDKREVPPDLTEEQYIDLTGDADAYRRLREGLKRAGLDPTTFPFDSGRRPYPGFTHFEEEDAAVFFGRDAQIVRGLDEIRRLAHIGVSRMLVILGASGSGKSSFLRAGLWPRLKRDDLAWLPLPIVRPERGAISGKYGLAQALYQVVSMPRFAGGIRRRELPRTRADIQDFIEKNSDGLARILAALREIAQPSDDAAAPTTLLAIDQGEELFNEDGQDEAKSFIEILTRMLAADPRTLAILVMRSDSFPLLQRDSNFGSLPKDAFTLDMMLKGSYRAVIEGPAPLVDPPVKIDPLLTDALLEDNSGQDALPLLAFTLAHLYDNCRADNELPLSGYDKIGRVRGVIDKTVAQAFADAVARGEAPEDEKAQLALARAAFIPHLARVNTAGQFVRKVALSEQIPLEARPLTVRFADLRLLIRDRRKDADGEDVDVLEVAHEALLRQPPFSEWLAEDREFLMWRERLSEARRGFEVDQRGLLADRELEIARSYVQGRAEPDFESADLAFIRDSIAADDKRRAEEAEQARAKEVAERKAQERRILDAERIAAEQRKAANAQRRFTWAAMVGFVFAIGLAVAAIWQYFDAKAQRDHALLAEQTANLARLEAQANARKAEASAQEAKVHLDEAQVAQEAADKAKRDALADRDRAVQAESNAKKSEAEAQLKAEEATTNLREAQIAQSRVITYLVQQQRNSVAGDAGSAILLALEALPDVDAGIARPFVPEAEYQLDGAWRALRERLLIAHDRSVQWAAFSLDGKRIVTASGDEIARISDAATGNRIGEPLKGHGDRVKSFSHNGQRIVTISEDNTMDSGVASPFSRGRLAQIWDASTGKPIGKPLRGHTLTINTAAFSPDGTRIVTTSADNTARIWDASTGEPVGKPLTGHLGPVFCGVFSPDGRRIVTGSYDRTARLWDAATGEPVGEPLKGHEQPVTSAAFSPDGLLIFTGSYDGAVRRWEAKSGRPIGGPATIHADAIWSVAFSPDGKLVVTASSDKKVRIWDAKTGERIGETLGGHNESASSAAFSPDGRYVVTASSDKTARIFDVGSRAVAGEPLLSHQGGVLSAMFSPDGQRIVTASADKTARIWDATSRKEIAKLVARVIRTEGTVFSA
jgi:WD40 repeat protein